MKAIAWLATGAGLIATVVDISFRLKGGYRVGYEQAVELLLLALIASVMALWRSDDSVR